MTNQSLGQKIKKFRTQAGFSQLQLETAISASPGSVSRIESGKVNPSKETLYSISEILELNGTQIAKIFNISSVKIAKLLNTAQHFTSKLDPDHISQECVNTICKELNLLGVILNLVKDDHLYAQAYTHKWYSDLCDKALSTPFKNLRIPLECTDQISVNAIENDKILYTTKFRFYSNHIISLKVSKIIEKITGFKCGICIPLKIDKKIIGTIFYAQDYITNFEDELPILKAYTNLVAIAIDNAIKFQRIKVELEGYKEMKSVGK